MYKCQVNEHLSFGREDEDADKVKALEFFAPPRSQVRRLIGWTGVSH